jgi:hypothetical protein
MFLKTILVNCNSSLCTKPGHTFRAEEPNTVTAEIKTADVNEQLTKK